MNLQQHNMCLLMKHLHKFLNRHKLPWVDLIWSTYYSDRPLTDRPVGSFWWKSILKLLPQFKQHVRPMIGDGKTIQLWHDLWRDNALSAELPELFSFTLKQTVTIHEMSVAANPIEFFHTPLSAQAFMQFQNLTQTLQSITLQEVQDKWKYNWNNFDFSSIKLYNSITQAPPAVPIFMTLWKNKTMLGYKIFFWFLLHDRSNTRNLLQRKNFHLPSYNCELCNTASKETLLHLFWDCLFALQCWDSLTHHRERGISVLDQIMLTLQELPTKFAMEVIIMTC